MPSAGIRSSSSLELRGLRIIRSLERRTERHRRPWRRHPPDARVQVFQGFLRDHGGDLGPEPEGLDRIVGDDEPVRLRHRGQDRLPVERRQRSQVDDLGIDPLGRQLRRGGQRPRNHASDRHNRRVGPAASNLCLSDRRQLLLLGNGFLGRPQVQAVNHDHGVVVSNRGLQKALRIGGSRRPDDLEARHVTEPCLEALTVLRAIVAPRAAEGPNRQRQALATARHVGDLSSLVHHLIHGQAHEVEEHDLDHGPEPGERGPYGETGDDSLADRGVFHTPRAELVQEPAARAEWASWRGNILAS